MASVSLPVKWERGFPTVLLASVYDVCCASCRGRQSHPKSGSDILPLLAPALAQLAQPSRLNACAKARASQRAAGWPRAGVKAGPNAWLFLLEQPAATWTRNVLIPSLGPGSALPFLCEPLLSLCWWQTGEGSPWAWGPNPGRLSSLGMTKPQWRGLCSRPCPADIFSPLWRPCHSQSAQSFLWA
uniref:Uncharacterized protein n=1 Tax=Cebus imitator TaxID=2715852 RepID=A0A2K5PTJ3_CEBIM